LTVGYAIAQSFAAAGVSKVVITSRSPESQNKAKKELNASFPDVEIVTIPVSLEDLDAMTKALNSAGPIDVLVLNAYYSHQLNVPSSTISACEIGKTFQANVVANWHLIQTYINSTPAPASGSKTIIAVSSAGSHLSIPGNTGYAASKAALNRIIDMQADEYTPKKNGVTLLSFHPGIIYTPGAKQYFSEDAFVYEDVKLPGDFAVWLASKEAQFLHGRFVWGQWDVDELVALKQRVEKEPTFLKIGLVY